MKAYDLPLVSADGTGLAFGWRDRAIEWESETLSMTAREFRAMALQRARNPLMMEDASELSRASDWLQTRLADGPVQSSLLKQEADDNEISYATLRRAFCALRIESTRIKNTRHHQWGARGTSHPRRTTGLEGESFSRDVGFEETQWGQAEPLNKGQGGAAEGLSCVGASPVAEAATGATQVSADDDVAVQVCAHDEHVLEHQLERVLDSVKHGVSSDFAIGVHGAQRKVEMQELLASK